jgi:hypothetical protein
MGGPWKHIVLGETFDCMIGGYLISPVEFEVAAHFYELFWYYFH